MTEKGVRARRKADRPRQILEAAFEEFVQHGYSATRLEDVAARAGVTKGTIYVYFENKEALFVSMATDMSRRHFLDLGSSVEAIEETGPAFMKRFLVLFRDKVIADRRMGEVLRLLIAEAPRFPNLLEQHYDEFWRPLIERVAMWLREGQANGTLRRSGIVDFPEMMLGPTMLLQIWLLLFADRNPVDIAAYFDAHLDFALNGLLSRTQPPLSDIVE
jgi:AcrR family transcriptional regulator